MSQRFDDSILYTENCAKVDNNILCDSFVRSLIETCEFQEFSK